MFGNLQKWFSIAFNSSILEKKRYKWVDYLRGIVIILVVYHHTYLGIERSGINIPKSIGNANMVFYSFRMPLFFIISGIFTSIGLTSKSIRSIAWTKFNILFYPYIVWSFIQITLQIILSRYTNSNRTFADYLYIFYQPKQLDQFWYLPALFNATMVFIFIKTKLKPRVGYHLLIGSIFYLLSSFINNISMMSNWMHFYIFFVIGDILSNVILEKTVQTRLRKPIYILIFIPVFIVAQYFYVYNNTGMNFSEIDMATFNGGYNFYIFNAVSFLFTSLIGCATFIIFSLLLEKWNRCKWLRIIGFHSLYIYIIQVIVVAFIRFLFNKLFGIDNYIIILLAGIAFGVTIPVIFYNLLGKTYFWFLFTTRKKQKENLNFRQSGFKDSITKTHASL